MIEPPPPPPISVEQVVPAPPPVSDDVVLSRSEHTRSVAAADLPLVLLKATRAERAMVRRQVFLSSSVRLTRSVSSPESAPSCHWTHKVYFQRQVCFNSMTGMFSCTEPELLPLPQAADGQVQLEPGADPKSCDENYAPAVQAADKLGADLAAGAEALFGADQRDKIDPLLAAAGVKVGAEPSPTPARRRSAAAKR
jgi:hypothetical protein